MRCLGTIVTTSILAAVLVNCGHAAKQQLTGQTVPVEDSKKTGEAPSMAGSQRPVIAAFGDSLTAGVVEHPYPEYLQAMLDSAGYNFHVENAGVSGETTSDGLARIDSVIGLKPALVVLEFGGNDGLRGIPVDESEKNLDQMLARFKETGIRIALIGITLPPNYGPEYVIPFNAMYPKLAHKYQVPLMPFLLLHVYQHSDMMQPDGIHPNSTGNKIVATDVFSFIKPLLQPVKASHR